MSDIQILILVTLTISVGCNLFGYLLSLAVLYSSLFDRFKIQKGRGDSSLLAARLPLVVFNIAVLLVLTVIGLASLGDFFVFVWPGTGFLLGEILLLFLVDDTFFYFYHRALHKIPFLYKSIHRIHHRAVTPFPLEYIYVHPLEWLGGTLGTVLGLALLFFFRGDINVYSFWGFALLRNLHEIDIHSGLRPVFAQHLPGIGTTEHHDLHHIRVNNGNYSSSFTFWDRLLGTTVSSQSAPDIPPE